MITVSSKGNFNNLERFLMNASKGEPFRKLEALAQEGVNALARATPIESGLTADSWYYEITYNVFGTSKITWLNRHVVDGVPIAIILQYGHGTGTGGYVEGRDYINPAIQPVFDKISEAVWKAVKSS